MASERESLSRLPEIQRSKVLHPGIRIIGEQYCLDDPGPEVEYASQWQTFKAVGNAFMQGVTVYVQQLDEAMKLHGAISQPSEPEFDPAKNLAVFNEPDLRGRRRR